MGWTGAAAAAIKPAGATAAAAKGAAEAVTGVAAEVAGKGGAARTIAMGAAAAAGATAGAAGLGQLTGGKIPDLRPGGFFEFSYTGGDQGPKVTRQQMAQFRAKYGKGKDTDVDAVLRDSFNQRREWATPQWHAQYMALQRRHTTNPAEPTEAQLRREWLRYWFGDKTAKLYD